jgi:hypothetical protein
MNRVDAFDRLEFDNHYSLDNEVKSKAALDPHALVRQLDVPLVLEGQLRVGHFDNHAFAVHRLE